MAIIVTDSTADIPPGLAAEHDIHVIPLTVNFDAESFSDGVEITHDQFYTRLVASNNLPTTSQPSVGAFEQLYRAIGNDEPIISIHIAGKLSGTIRSAQQAAELLPDFDIRVIDVQSTTMSQGWAALLAARAAKEGKSADEIEALVHSIVERTRLLAALDTLRYLEKGGRIGKTRALLGTLLNVKPIIDVRDGEVKPFEQVRSKKKAVARLIEEARNMAPFEELAVLYSRNEEEAQEFAQSLNEIFPAERIVLAEIGAVVGTHIGPGALGFTGVRKNK
ncbi:MULTISPECIES: DegV family protein [Herpetosiphon]|uniref:DegV family protein n=1 Tax=Herpetosiphon TaxID=64 RepID=UPI0013E093E0|nr:DegV family protein [Herpetosiphon llansteffanensis]